MDPRLEKARLRRDALTRRNLLPEGERRERSARILRNLRGTTEWGEAGTVAAYAAVRGEVDTWELLEDPGGRRIAVPSTDVAAHALTFHEVTDPRALTPGAFDVPESSGPVVPLEEVDLVVVPGVAFDRDGFRVGYGAGYYDDLLRGISCPTLGLAFVSQVVDRVPREDHDVPVGGVVTEEGVLQPGDR